MPRQLGTKMTQNINELAQAAIDALQAINAIHKEWRDTLATKSGHGQYVRRRPCNDNYVRNGEDILK